MSKHTITAQGVLLLAHEEGRLSSALAQASNHADYASQPARQLTVRRWTEQAELIRLVLNEISDESPRQHPVSQGVKDAEGELNPSCGAVKVAQAIAATSTLTPREAKRVLSGWLADMIDGASA